VTLSGAHTLGHVHLQNSGYSVAEQQVPRDAEDHLVRRDADASTVLRDAEGRAADTPAVDADAPTMDITVNAWDRSPTIFDNLYFKYLLELVSQTNYYNLSLLIIISI